MILHLPLILIAALLVVPCHGYGDDDEDGESFTTPKASSRSVRTKKTMPIYKSKAMPRTEKISESSEPVTENGEPETTKGGGRRNSPVDEPETTEEVSESSETYPPDYFGVETTKGGGRRNSPVDEPETTEEVSESSEPVTEIYDPEPIEEVSESSEPETTRRGGRRNYPVDEPETTAEVIESSEPDIPGGVGGRNYPDGPETTEDDYENPEPVTRLPLSTKKPGSSSRIMANFLIIFAMPLIGRLLDVNK